MEKERGKREVLLDNIVLQQDDVAEAKIMKRNERTEANKRLQESGEKIRLPAMHQVSRNGDVSSAADAEGSFTVPAPLIRKHLPSQSDKTCVVVRWSSQMRRNCPGYKNTLFPRILQKTSV